MRDSVRLANCHPFPTSHFTVFVVPFRYRVLAGPGSVHGRYCYVEDENKGTVTSLAADPGGKAADMDALKWLRARFRYLLPETQSILFDRAAWFNLRRDQGEGAAPIGLLGRIAFFRGKPVEIRFSAAPPRVVLFEWPRAVSASTREDDGQICCTGFLLLSVVLMPGNNNDTFDNLLDLNQRLRYLEPPYYLTAPRVDERSNLEILTADGGSGYQFLPDQDADRDLTFDEYMLRYYDRYWHFWERLITKQPGQANESESDITYWRGGRGYRIEIGRRLGSRGSRGGTDGQHQGQKELRSLALNPRDGADVYPDDRAFVYTFACVNGLGSPGPLHQDKGKSWVNVWHSLLDVDGAGSYVRRIGEYQHRWLAKRTYERWLPDSLYGFTNFSAALLSNGDGSPFDLAYFHFLNLYLDQLLLLLYLRVCLFGFSNRISSHTAIYADGKQPNADIAFRALRQEFAILTNLYQFPMFTTQYQGLEMYAYLRTHLDIDAIYREVETEVRVTDEFLSRLAQKEIEEKLRGLQRYGAVFAIVAVVLAEIQVLQSFHTRGAFELGWPYSLAVALGSWLGLGQGRGWSYLAVADLAALPAILASLVISLWRKRFAESAAALIRMVTKIGALIPLILTGRRNSALVVATWARSRARAWVGRRGPSDPSRGSSSPGAPTTAA